ncbi:ATP-binding cassette domain-containing protein [candidate division KSB1 bacterium]
MSILEVKNVTLSLGDKDILNNISIDVWEGNVHAIVGPNGAGKSTLSNTIMGLSNYRDIEGDILFEGESIKHLDVSERSKKGITLAWQEPARFEGLTVRQFLSAGAKDKSEDNIKNALRQVALEPEDYLSRAVDKTLSGGERKKVELAAIMVMEPKLVLLDEPDSGIDMESLDRIFNMIKILKIRGSTVILITHSLAVLRQAEHAFLVCHGRIIDKGSIENISGYFDKKCLPCPHKNIPNEKEIVNEFTSGS